MKVAADKDPIVPRLPRLPPILWEPQTLWTATLQVYGVDKRRYVAITPLDDGRWNVTGFETDVTEVETEEEAILTTLGSHAHKFLGIEEDFKEAKKKGEAFLHELCQAARCEHLTECECKEVEPSDAEARGMAETIIARRTVRQSNKRPRKKAPS